MCVRRYMCLKNNIKFRIILGYASIVCWKDNELLHTHSWKAYENWLTNNEAEMGNFDSTHRNWFQKSTRRGANRSGLLNIWNSFRDIFIVLQKWFLNMNLRKEVAERKILSFVRLELNVLILDVDLIFFF